MLNQKEIADNLKIHRKRLGLTQEQLGEKVGITAVHYGHIERCESGITLELLIRLAEVFKVGLNDLLGSNVPSCIRVDVDQRLVDLLESDSR